MITGLLVAETLTGRKPSIDMVSIREQFDGDWSFSPKPLDSDASVRSRLLGSSSASGWGRVYTPKAFASRLFDIWAARLPQIGDLD